MFAEIARLPDGDGAELFLSAAYSVMKVVEGGASFGVSKLMILFTKKNTS